MSEEDTRLTRLIKSALTAIDGLWFLAVEEKLGFDTAFEIDLNVWKRYGPIITKRIQKAYSIEDNSLESFLQILKITCSIDGTQFKILKQSPHEILLHITYCPWFENLKRSNREKLVRCDVVDKEIFPGWAQSFNPKIKFEMTKSLPNGDAVCEWLISLES